MGMLTEPTSKKPADFFDAMTEFNLTGL